MMTRVNKIFIGKDINRTAELVDDAAFTVVQANIVEGEIVVLDKNFAVLAETGTYADSNIIYVAEGTDETVTYTNEAGTSITSRKVILSDAIDGARVVTYNGKDYAAKSEEIVTLGAITGTITAGTEYVLRLVYTDITEHPGQFTQTYRYVAVTGDTSQTVFNGLRARIAKHTGRLSIGGGTRVTATGTTTLILTGKPIPGTTTSVNDIDEFSMVNFDVYFNYVDNDGNWQTVPSTVTKTVGSYGNGTWEAIRDIEKRAMSYKGIMNRTTFPVIMPAFRTVKNETYNTIVIEHEQGYRSPDNQYKKEASVTTMIACPSTAVTGFQLNNVVTVLDSWMASLPNAFAAADITPVAEA